MFALLQTLSAPLKPLATVLIYSRGELRRLLWNSRCWTAFVTIVFGQEKSLRLRNINMRPTTVDSGEPTSSDKAAMQSQRVHSESQKMELVHVESRC